MKIQELLNEKLYRDDIDDLWDGIKKIVKDKAKRKKILNAFHTTGGDTFTDDEEEELWLKIKKVVSDDEGKAILKLMRSLE